MEQAPHTVTHRMSSPIPVRGLGATIHNSDQYAKVDIYLTGVDGRTAVITREAHIVNDLRAKMLVGIDVLATEGITMDLPRKIAVISSYANIKVPLTITTKSTNQVSKAILAKQRTIIPPHSNLAVAIIEPDLPDGRDFLFEPDCRQADAAVYAHIVDHMMSEVHVRNDSDFPLVVPRKSRMGQIVEYKAEDCYLATADDAVLASTSRRQPMRQGWIKTAMRGLLAAAAVFHTSMDGSLERKLPNGITVYGPSDTSTQIEAVVNELPHLFEDRGNVVDVPKSEWMDIPLLDEWREKYKPGQARVYPLGANDRAQVDKAFDKLHDQDRMERTSTATPFSFPCFVVWRTLSDNTRKGRVIVDIRALNKISMPDAYPVPSQADILAAVQGAKYILTVDCSAYFYQWRVNPEHRHRLTVASHCGQETFKVAVMGYRNTPAYVQ